MTVPEWVAVLSITGVGCVLWCILWYWVRGIIKSTCETVVTLGGINIHLAKINGRIEKTEQILTLNQAANVLVFKRLDDDREDIWEEIKDIRRYKEST